MSNYQPLQLAMDLDPVRPDAAGANLIEAECERQRVRLFQCMGDLRVSSASAATAATADTSTMLAPLTVLEEEYLAGGWEDLDLRLDVEQLIVDSAAVGEPLDQSELCDELSQLFLSLRLPTEDGFRAWEAIERLIQKLRHDHYDHMVDVDNRCVLAATLAPADMDEPATGLARCMRQLAALPKRVRECFGLYRDDELRAPTLSPFRIGTGWHF
ncbi:hypothetical protein [Salicola sp. Rm-C-2C1-2]|uniref:hypothetical protein n=1 Tax=Salicola sp. Rm-C-2C1-2 TaxID=3141321 RepID=UPI0032E524F7